MTPNNLHGRTHGIEWEEVYREKLPNGLFVVITHSYDKSNVSDFLSTSSHVCAQAVVTDGNTHTYTNGVFGYRDFPDARVPFEHTGERLETKHGWPVYQTKLKGDRVGWVAEVPMDAMLNPPQSTVTNKQGVVRWFAWMSLLKNKYRNS